MSASTSLPPTSTPAADAPPKTTGPTATVPIKPTGAQLLASFPPRPVPSSWPATQASRSAVVARVLAVPFALVNPASQQSRRLGVLAC
ncbi:MAG: hypothetical protein M3460_21670 [Actinomycetota bacterium]|nr:hypothetical protein [Actinomycetota bacterium]